MAVLLWDLCRPDSCWSKGIATGLIAGIKLVPLIFIPYLLLTRRYWAAAMALAGFATSVVLGFAVLPVDSGTWWLRGVFAGYARTGFVGWGGNQSLRGTLTRLAGSIDGATPNWVAAALFIALIGLASAVLLDRAGHLMLAVLATALVGLLDSPVSWDHHWVWVVPGLMAAGLHAAGAWRAGRRAAAGCAALAVALLLVFAPWPGRLWSDTPASPGDFSSGLIWAGPNSPAAKYQLFGDQPWFAEYHWRGLQNVAGNAYVLAGLALLVLLAVIALSTRLPSGRSGAAHSGAAHSGRGTTGPAGPLDRPRAGDHLGR